MKPIEYVYEGITVVGNDTESGHTVIFMVLKEGAIAFSFPMQFGQSQKISEEELKKFFLVTPNSEMLERIKDAYKKLRVVPS